MSQTSSSELACGYGAGAACFDNSRQAQVLEASSEAEGWLIVRPDPPLPTRRGQLASLLGEAIERGLRSRHAPPPGVGATRDWDGALSDQLYRARACGTPGLCVCVPSLRGMVGSHGALDVEDSAVLRWWLKASTERPLRLVLNSDNLSLGVHTAPIALYRLLEADVGTPQLPAASPPLLFDAPRAAAVCAEAIPEHRPVSMLFPEAEQHWKTWVRQLDEARGPRPLSAVERLFRSAYLPLTEAAMRTVTGAEASEVLEAWAQSFANSYSEAFGALRIRGKRPTMVLDTPELAHKIARLHGARSVQLVLVDGMRFDLGLRMRDRLSALTSGHTTLCDEMVLWAALPSTTSAQLELIGRGSDGLREQGTVGQSEVTVARGRGAATLRRLKAGSCDILKLDTVESRLSEPGPPLLERLDALAESTAEALGNHLLKLSERTLVLVFGDHGFLCEPVDRGTGPARHGGARPEEVLVPGFAWLVGSVH
jgi:hypothetical protein